MENIRCNRFKEGMRVGEDIFLENGTLLVSKNTIITKNMIQTLSKHGFGRFSVVRRFPPINQESYINRIRETEDFKSFHHAFTDTVNEFQDKINDVVLYSKEIDLKVLIEEIDQIFVHSRTGMQIFDMLHCMRDYDDSTYIHSVNVGLICSIVGKWLKMPQEEVEILSICGLLHDIGKLVVPKEIIVKPGGLTKEEYLVVKAHPSVGHDLVKEETMDVRIKQSIYMHHEKCDGSGYPRGLKGSQIADFAKIVTLADVYDAMTANRVYRKGLCPFEVIEVFRGEGFEKYDPRFLVPFLERVVESYINKPVRLSNKREGYIVMINKFEPTRPVIRLGEEYVDLTKEPELYIEAIL